MTDSSTIVRDAIEGVAPDIDAATIRPDANLRDDIGLDSLDFLHVVAAVHETTGVDVPERDYPRIATLRLFAEYLDAARTP
jgi:acyl carrier protein